MGERLKTNLSDKLLLILIKFLPHCIAFLYVCYTILLFVGIDLIVMGYFVHVSLLPWITLILMSYRLKFCYVHRLPLYYILVNEILSSIDYLLLLPISEYTYVSIHLILIIFLILGYTRYYEKYSN